MLERLLAAKVNFQLRQLAEKSLIRPSPVRRQCQLPLNVPVTSLYVYLIHQHQQQRMSDYAVPRPGGSLKFKGDDGKCVPFSRPPAHHAHRCTGSERCGHYQDCPSTSPPHVMPAPANGRKKKKKKSHSSDDRAKKEADVTAAATIAESSASASKRSEREHERDERRGSGSASASASPAPPSASAPGRKMTDAERRFEEVQRKRVSRGQLMEHDGADVQREERAKRNAHQTHKERVAQLNARLDSMSEHYDMPRVSAPLVDADGQLAFEYTADTRSDQAKSGGTSQGVPLCQLLYSLFVARCVCMCSEDRGLQ